MSRARRAVVVAVLLVVAAVITYVQFGRIGGTTQTGMPPDAPPAGVAVFYARNPGNPHGLIAYDWSGTRRGYVTLPTWVEVSRLQPAPDGSAFFLDPSTPGDYAAYFDRGGRTVFETDDPGFISQAWAEDSTHVCVLSEQGLAARVPGQPDRVVSAPSGVNLVAACSLRADMVVLSSTEELRVVQLSTGKTLRRLGTGGTVLASTDAAYIAVVRDPAEPAAVYKTSDLTRPVAQLEAGLQPLAFSGDDSLLLASQPGGDLKAISVRTGKVAWTYDAYASGIDFVVTRPSGGDFVLYFSSGVVLLRRDGKTATFG